MRIGHGALSYDVGKPAVWIRIKVQDSDFRGEET